MPTQDLGSMLSSALAGQAGSIDLRGLEAARRSLSDTHAENVDAIAQAERDQLARDIADIERAAAVLRRVEPALETWTVTPPARLHKPRPLWLIIGALWLSTALATAGAVVVIAVLAG